MSSSWPKIIRDPVHNIVPFEDTACDKLLLNLINTREFQRLRRIKQLGLSQLVFPGADHSRFAHSIGVMQVARRFLNRILKLCPTCVVDDQRTVVLAASLLHDIGHGPFSHAFEKVSGEKHEKRTLEIITDESTEINQVLRDYCPNLPDRLKVFFDEDIEEERKVKAEIPAYLTQVVTSQLDADRFDYLLRDSYATGTDYDLAWLLEHLNIDNDRGRFYLGQKALYAAESYVFARYHMYRTVYFHKTTRSAEVMLRLLLRRYKELLSEADTEEKKRKIVADVPSATIRAFSGKIRLDEYLSLDDHSLTEFAKACAKSTDSVLKPLAEGLLHRRLYKATDVTHSVADNVQGIVVFSEKAKEIISAAGFNVNYAFENDAPSDTAYKLYNPDADAPATQIYIENLGDGQVELSRQSDSVGQLAKQYTLTRYYYPADVRDQIRTVAEPFLYKE
jgi:HD superfamily phosphohydrolase